MGVEPMLRRWQRLVLPLYYARFESSCFFVFGTPDTAAAIRSKYVCSRQTWKRARIVCALYTN